MAKVGLDTPVGFFMLGVTQVHDSVADTSYATRHMGNDGLAMACTHT